VILLESAHPPLRKVCGEFLSDPGMELLRRLADVSPDRFPRLRSVAFHRAADGGRRRGRSSRPAILRLDPPGWGICRSTLDGLLLDACAAAGVEVRCGTRATDTRRENGGWIVAARVAESGNSPAALSPVAAPATFRSRRLVRADGRRPALQGAGGLWIGRKWKAEPPRRVADLDIHFTAGGYYGVSPVEESGVSLCGVWKDSAPVWEGPGEREGGTVEVTKGTPRFALGLARPRDPGSFSVGDAKATWPPLTGDGITMALHGGALLGERLGDPEFDAAAWDRTWRRHFDGALKRSLLAHDALQIAGIQAVILAGAASSRLFGEWLLRRSRFMAETREMPAGFFQQGGSGA
jgi:flavin-dependent dehydrogenase